MGILAIMHTISPLHTYCMLEWLLQEHMPCYRSTYLCMITVTSEVEQDCQGKRRAEQACARGRSRRSPSK